MDLAKVYYDSGGCSGNILQIVKREPEWAANRIQEGEKAIEWLNKALSFLECVPCNFWACKGPDDPIPMITCSLCNAIILLRESNQLLKEIKK